VPEHLPCTFSSYKKRLRLRRPWSKFKGALLTINGRHLGIKTFKNDSGFVKNKLVNSYKQTSNIAYVIGAKN